MDSQSSLDSEDAPVQLERSFDEDLFSSVEGTFQDEENAEERDEHDSEDVIISDDESTEDSDDSSDACDEGEVLDNDVQNNNPVTKAITKSSNKNEECINPILRGSLFFPYYTPQEAEFHLLILSNAANFTNAHPRQDPTCID